MQWLDWILIAIPLLLVVSIGVYTQRYLKSVSDFLSGGRLAGRYLLAVSKGEIGAGAVSFAAAFEIFNKSGFATNWWGSLAVPVTLFLMINGFVYYRYRETKAMTLAQFFEIRYSKSFRVFTGFLGFWAGIVNFGIIPAVGARFIAHFMGFPPTLHLFLWDIQTYIPVMAVLLGLTVFITLTGGFITLMITDCLEGLISQLFYLLLIFGLLSMFHWSQISHVLADNRPHGESLMNSFDAWKLKDFNIWYVLMSMVVSIYGTMAWQNQSAYNSAAISAHEARMSNIISHWRISGKRAVMVLLSAGALTFLQHPDFAVQSKAAHAEINEIQKKQIREQMQSPIALKHMLPTGLKGAFCVILLMGIFGGDGTHLHSWGGMFIQDVVVPLRKKPLDPKQHIKWLRWGMGGVAFFAFVFGSLFNQTDYIQMWWAVTMSLYVGGAGSAIIGGLYWKKGTTAGAWAGMITGSALSTAGIIAKSVIDHFPMNGMQISFYSMLIAIAVYVVVSLITCKEDYNMDRMLHRGQYAIDRKDKNAIPRVSLWNKMIGLDANFSRGDRIIAYTLFGWTMFWFAVFVVCTVWNFVAPWPTSWWSKYHEFTSITIAVAIAVLITVWFTWGTIKDLKEFFRRLKLEKVNILDNGMVIGHQNLSEIVHPPVAAQSTGGEKESASGLPPFEKQEIR